MLWALFIRSELAGTRQ